MLNFKLYLPVIFSLILIIILCMGFSGCYTLKQGAAMIGYLNRAVPLEKVEDKDFVNLVTDIRRFAIDELGLSMSKNYTRYAEIDRDYLAAVVSASAKDSFERYEWNYPVVGRLPYKGFFNVEDARKERTRLEKLNLDVWIRGVDAFSTLGWFKDPLYSYMRNYSPSRLADLIIHELTHATVFIKGQANFNEELAEFIGSEGALFYIESRYGIDSDEYRQIQISNTDNKNYVAFIQELIAELETLYSSENSGAASAVLEEKDKIIKKAKERFNAEYESRFSSGNYRGFSEIPVNNAFLELYRLYYTKDNFFKDLYERSGGSLSDFIKAAKTIKKGNNPREQLEKALMEK